MYISECSKHYNDIPVNYEEEHKQMLLDAGLIFVVANDSLFLKLRIVCKSLLFIGVDETLAIHISHLFIRDPVSLFAEKINLNDEVDTDHFEVHCVFKI